MGGGGGRWVGVELLISEIIGSVLDYPVLLNICDAYFYQELGAP